MRNYSSSGVASVLTSIITALLQLVEVGDVVEDMNSQTNNSLRASESIGKDYFRLGNEVDFRGNKSLYVNPPYMRCSDRDTHSAPVHGAIGVVPTPSSLRS